MTVAHRLHDLSVEAMRGAVGDLLAGATALERADRVVVLPDVHYPFHPSTGLVTNPTLVEALVDVLETEFRVGDVVVDCVASEMVAGDRAAGYLGYDRVANRTGAAVRYPDPDPEAGGESDQGPSRRSLGRGTVVNVPSLRYDEDLGVAGGLANRARVAAGRLPTPEDVATWASGSGPTAAVTLLDGTYAYVGEPRRPQVLLAGTKTARVDRTAASLLGVDPAGVPDGEAAVPEVDPEVSQLLDRSTVEDAGGSALSSPLVRRGYRLYARLAGDVVPPEVLDE
jgi:uncharacterized protein (DUF362 family)